MLLILTYHNTARSDMKHFDLMKFEEVHFGLTFQSLTHHDMNRYAALFVQVTILNVKLWAQKHRDALNSTGMQP